ncbi:Calpain-type cysteine protease ADL1 [Diplonema papillatum]|nr:Calpain-type cysteine protease ADL1 [Diplonema papillatum]
MGCTESKPAAPKQGKAAPAPKGAAPPTKPASPAASENKNSPSNNNNNTNNNNKNNNNNNTNDNNTNNNNTNIVNNNNKKALTPRANAPTTKTLGSGAAGGAALAFLTKSDGKGGVEARKIAAKPGKLATMPDKVTLPISEPAGCDIDVSQLEKSEGFDKTYHAGVAQYVKCIGAFLFGSEDELPSAFDTAMENRTFHDLCDKFVARASSTLLSQHQKAVDRALDDMVDPIAFQEFDKKTWASRKEAAKSEWAKAKAKAKVSDWFKDLGRREWYKANAKTPLHDDLDGKKKRKPAVRGVEVVIKPDVLSLIVKQAQKQHPTHNVYAFNASDEQEITLKAGFASDAKAEPSEHTTIDADGHFSIVIMPGETLLYVTGSFPKGLIDMDAMPTFEPKPTNVTALSRRARGAKTAILNDIDKLTTALPDVCFNETPMVDDRKLTGVTKVINKCLFTPKVPFIDPYFPPTQHSIGSNKMPPMAWKRPPAFLEGRKAVFDIKDVKVSDIEQGTLGDCWWSCAVGILCERPKLLIDQIFATSDVKRTEKERALGIYRVRICKEGWWQDVVVDEYLPCAGMVPTYARHADPNNIWVSILQKAYAKLHGSYEGMLYGETCDALCDLTGFPLTKLNQAGELTSAMWTDLMKLKKLENGVLYLSTQGVELAAMGQSQEIATEYATVGLAAGYSFPVLQMKEFMIGNETVELVQLRNHWGDISDWKGEWSQKSPLWHKYPAVARECKYNPTETDKFWMLFSDCLSWFASCGFVHCLPERTSFRDIRYKGNLRKEDGLFEFVLQLYLAETTDVFISIHQKSYRENALDHPMKDLAAVRLAVIRSTDEKDKMEVVKFTCEEVDPETNEKDGIFSPACNVSQKLPNLTAGTYYVVVEAANSEERVEANKSKELVISVQPLRTKAGQVTTLAITDSMKASQELVDFWGFLQAPPVPYVPKGLQIDGVEVQPRDKVIF